MDIARTRERLARALVARAAFWPPVLIGGFLTELEAHARWYFSGGEAWSFYLEGGLGALAGYTTAFALGFGPVLPRLGTVVGFEWPSEGGVTAGLSFGNNLFYVPGQGQIFPSPTGYLQVGYAF